MPPSVLQNIVTVAALAPGAQVSLPHGLTDRGVGLIPNRVMPDRPTSIAVVSADATNVVFENPVEAPEAATAIFLTQFDHTIQQATASGLPANLYYQGGAGGATASVAQLWSLPSPANAADDEFNGAALSGDWELDDGAGVINFSATPVDSYDNGFVAGTPRIDYNNSRPSWALVQPPANNTLYTLTKTLAIPANALIYARVKLNTPFPFGSADGRLGIVMGASSGGRFDRNNYVRLYLDHLGSLTNRVTGDKIIGGGTTNLGSTTSAARAGTRFAWVAIHKVGANVWVWTGTEVGAWVNTTNPALTAFAPAVDRIGFIFGNVQLVTPGPAIGGWDCIRVIENVTDFVL